MSEQAETEHAGRPVSFAQWLLSREKDATPTVDEYRRIGSMGASLFRVRLTEVFSDPASPDVTLQLATAGYCDIRGEMGFGRYSTCAVAGEFAVTPPGQPARAEGAGKMEMLVLALPWEALRVQAESAAGKKVAHFGRLHAGIQRDATVERLLLSLWHDARGDGPLETLFADGLLTGLVARLLRLSEQGPEPLPEGAVLSRSELRRAVEYIHAHLGGDLSLGAIASQVGYSPYHLHRLFRAATGTTPHQYVTERRVERARHLLVNTDLPAAEVAAAAGFSDQTALTRHCKRILGVTPGALRPNGRAAKNGKSSR